jgi:hypothetical protein
VATGAILAVGAILLVVMAMIGNSEEIGYPDTFDFQPADYEAGTAVVTSKRMNEGSKILGFVLRDPEYHVAVAFAVRGEECYQALAEQEAWPVPEASCPNSGSVSGLLSGIGITAEGDTYVGVTITVAEECFADVELGVRWPPSLEACAR